VSERIDVTKEQAAVLEAVIRYLYWGSKPARGPTSRDGGGAREFRHWERRIMSSGLRLLRKYQREGGSISPRTLRRALADLLPSPASDRKEGT
jgi:hypothetical protein